MLRGLVRLGRQRAGQGQEGDLRSLGDWFHETVAQATGSPALTTLLIQLRRKITWLYAAEPVGRAVASWQERGALVDAIARGDAERARVLTTAQLERAAPARKLPRATPARPWKPAVNTGRAQI